MTDNQNLWALLEWQLAFEPSTCNSDHWGKQQYHFQNKDVGRVSSKFRTWQTESMHPCQSCGACCATYRVSFSQSELDTHSAGKVPVEVVDDPNQKTVSLTGTAKSGRPACAQLKGRIGQQVACQIYECRPSPCRNFKASFEDGLHRPRCDEARKAHGLKPLKRQDWVKRAPLDL